MILVSGAVVLMNSNIALLILIAMVLKVLTLVY